MPTSRWLPFLCVSLAVAASGLPTRAEDWPGWRGPRGDGTSLEHGLPLHWSAGKDGGAAENILWKVPLPGAGHASPIVVGDRVFVVSCDAATEERLLLCFEAASGRQLWSRPVLRAPLEIKHKLNSHASSTPASDGRLVFVSFWETSDKRVPALHVPGDRDASFGPMVVAAYDLDGNERWLVRPGDFASCHGYCSCPVVEGDKVILNGDHDGDGFLVALDRATGATRWKVPRSHNTRSYCTPIVRTFAGRRQLILSGSRHVAGYDPETGRELWRVEGPTEQFVASMVDDGRLVFLTAGFPDKLVAAIDPTGDGDVTATHLKWKALRNCGYVPAPIVAGNRLLLTSDDGVAGCLDTASGERLWTARAGGHYSGSPFSADGLVYFTDDVGVTKVVRPGPSFEVVAENDLGEECYSSPAVSGGRIFFRTAGHLVCVGGKPQAASAPPRP
jgi:outer membrane protein assembly factor BamB